MCLRRVCRRAGVRSSPKCDFDGLMAAVSASVLRVNRGIQRMRDASTTAAREALAPVLERSQRLHRQRPRDKGVLAAIDLALSSPKQPFHLERILDDLNFVEKRGKRLKCIP